MKLKLFFILLLAIILFVVPRSLLGFSIWHIGDALNVAASMGAKLACSGKYITKLDEHQIKQDLRSYSPANDFLEITYDANKKTATADMLGLSSYSATYRDGIGCALDIEDTSHLDQLIATRITLPKAPWPGGNKVETIQEEKQSLLDGIVQQDNEQGLQTRALVWIENDIIVAESYGEGFDQNSMHLGWSMGKSLTAMMLARMEFMGLANLQESNLFSAWSKDNRKHINLENLLQMSSGLAFDETYAPGSDSTKMLFMAPSASDVALTAEKEFRPGEHFSYSSGTTNILSRWMYERLGGNLQSSYNFLQLELLTKLNMAHSIFETDPSGVFVGSSYIYATGRDWGRLGLLMLNKGVLGNGERLINEEWITKASKPNNSNNYNAYGYQFWLNDNISSLEYPDLPKDAYFMLGNRKQAVMIAPSQNTVIVRLGWTSGSYPMNKNFSKLLNMEP